MKNPWLLLPRTAPFLLPSDEGQVAEFNSKAKDDCKIRLNLLPVPYIGSKNAPVVLLNLNPGYNPLDEILQSTARFHRICRGCLTHSRNEYPFFYLDPKVEGNEPGPGYKWWNRVLQHYLQIWDAKTLSRVLLCVELFPYHSSRFVPLPRGQILGSQHYGFNLVRSAIKRNALIVIMRSQKRWFQCVPELADYERLIHVRNPRCPILSDRNLEDGGFERIKSELRRAI